MPEIKPDPSLMTRNMRYVDNKDRIINSAEDFDATQLFRIPFTMYWVFWMHNMRVLTLAVKKFNTVTGQYEYTLVG